MAEKVFISYNHKDKDTAIRVENYLTDAGLTVIRDENAMRSGEDIRKFILRCIRESGVTLSLISSNSLLSAWVGMETVLSQFESDMGTRYFIPAYIDGSFFELDFTDKSLDEIDEKVEKLNAMMQKRLQRNRSTRDIQDELQRYKDLAHSLDEIVGRLRGMLCIDISGDAFEVGMKKITEDIRAVAPPTQSNAQATSDNGGEPAKASNLDGIKEELRDLFARAREKKLFERLEEVISKESELRATLTSIRRQSRDLSRNQYLMDTRDHATQKAQNQQRLLHLIEDLSPDDLA